LSLNLNEKQAVVSDITAQVGKSQTMVIAEYRGITVADMTKLRKQARSNDVYLRVLKNTLARRAVTGSSFEVAGDQMVGPLIYSFSADAVAAAKIINDFAKTNDKLVIKAGAYNGKLLSKDQVIQLASVPSKEVLLAQLCGLLASPISRFARVLGAVSEQKNAGAPVAAAEVAPAAAEAPVAEAAAAAPSPDATPAAA
jgi:large subunit ribosomal protein L10